MKKLFNIIVMVLAVVAVDLFSMEKPTSEGRLSRVTQARMDRVRDRMDQRLYQQREQARQQGAANRRAAIAARRRVENGGAQQRLFDNQ